MVHIGVYVGSRSSLLVNKRVFLDYLWIMKKTILRLPVKPRNSPLAVTIGMFDGMHRGHQELFAKTLGSALPLKAVMTFDEDFKAIAMKSARP